MAELDIKQGYNELSDLQIIGTETRYSYALNTACEKLLRPNLRWLDIGPNRGFGLKKLDAPGIQVTAIDIVEAYLSEALISNPAVNGALMSGFELGFPSETFDVVSFFEVIEHMDEPNQRALLAESKRALKPGGLLFLSTPNKVASGKRRMSPDHAREVTREELDKLLSSAGFHTLDRLGQGFLNDSWTNKAFRWLRENDMVTYIYYYLLPPSLRMKFKDRISDALQGNEIRKPTSNEMERIMYTYCVK